MASVLGLVFGGLRIADTVDTANAYSRTVQLADVGKQVTALAQAMEDERDLTVGVQALSTLQQERDHRRRRASGLSRRSVKT